MEIRIKIQRLIGDMQTKSRLELANLQDVTSRYKMEIGTEKFQEIRRDIESASSTIVGEFSRFLYMPVMDIADDKLNDDSEIVFCFVGSSRRLDGKEKAIAQKIHEVLVDLTMQKYYISVAAGDLSKAHEKQAIGGMEELNRMLRRKSAPKIVEP